MLLTAHQTYLIAEYCLELMRWTRQSPEVRLSVDTLLISNTDAFPQDVGSTIDSQLKNAYGQILNVAERSVISDVENKAGAAVSGITKTVYGNGDNRPSIPVTQDQFDEFLYWAQMNAASYCPDNIAHGRKGMILSCGIAGNCKAVEADGWETIYEFKEYVEVPAVV